jgi:hypothetical protein
MCGFFFLFAYAAAVAASPTTSPNEKRSRRASATFLNAWYSFEPKQQRKSEKGGAQKRKKEIELTGTVSIVEETNDDDFVSN